MYKTIIALLTVSLLTACQGENDNKVKFKAEIKGVDDDTEAIFLTAWTLLIRLRSRMRGSR